MTVRRAESFDLALSSVPIINLRLDFNRLLGFFRNELFRDQFKGDQGVVRALRTPYFTWYGRPNVLLTHLLREAIVNLESAVSSAVWMEAGERGLTKGKWREAIDNPMSLGKGTAHCVFNLLPALIDPDFAMRACDQELWKRFRALYKEVRNGLFHSMEIESDDPSPVLDCLELLHDGHGWLNSWHPIEEIAAGPIRWSPETIATLRAPPEVPDHEVRQLMPIWALTEEYRTSPQSLPPGMVQLDVADVSGVSLPPSELVVVSLVLEDGSHAKLNLSPGAAMHLLLRLAQAQQARGWALPDRI